MAVERVGAAIHYAKSKAVFISKGAQEYGGKALQAGKETAKKIAKKTSEVAKKVIPERVRQLKILRAFRRKEISPQGALYQIAGIEVQAPTWREASQRMAEGTQAQSPASVEAPIESAASNSDALLQGLAAGETPASNNEGPTMPKPKEWDRVSEEIADTARKSADAMSKVSPATSEPASLVRSEPAPALDTRPSAPEVGTTAHVRKVLIEGSLVNYPDPVTALRAMAGADIPGSKAKLQELLQSDAAAPVMREALQELGLPENPTDAQIKDAFKARDAATEARAVAEAKGPKGVVAKLRARLIAKQGGASQEEAGQHVSDQEARATNAQSEQPSSPSGADSARPDLGGMNAGIDAIVQPVVERKAGEEAYTTWQGLESDLRAKLKARAEKDPSRALAEDHIHTRVQRLQERSVNRYVRTNLEANNRNAVETFIGRSDISPVFVDQARIALQRFDTASKTKDTLPVINTTTHDYVQQQWQNVGKAAGEAYRARSMKKGEKPDDPKIRERMKRSIGRAQQRAVREYVASNLDNNNRQVLNNLLAGGKLDATLVSQLSDAIRQYDAQKAAATTVDQNAAGNPADATVATNTDNESNTLDDTTPDATQEAQEKTEEQILDEMLGELNKRVPRKDRSEIPGDMKGLAKAAREFAGFDSKGDREVVSSITRALRLAKISEQLANVQEEQKIWAIVAGVKSSEEFDTALEVNRDAINNALKNGDPENKVKGLESARENLKKAKEMAREKKVYDMSEDARQQETSKLADRISNLEKRHEAVAELFVEGMKTFEAKKNKRFYKELANLPATLQKNPELAAQLVQLYKDGKKKKLRGILLGTLLLVGVVVAQDLVQNGPSMLASDMPGGR